MVYNKIQISCVSQDTTIKLKRGKIFTFITIKEFALRTSIYKKRQIFQIKKWQKYWQYYMKEDIQMANKYIKNCFYLTSI